jgi:hypothetical protein
MMPAPTIASRNTHTTASELQRAGRHRKEPHFYRPIRRTPLIVPFGPADGVTVMPVPGGETAAVLGGRTSTLAKARTLLTPCMRRRLGCTAA